MPKDSLIPSIPEPEPLAKRYSEELTQFIVDEIRRNNDWIGFNRFMEFALYTPGLGYYAGGSQKFGSAGDFVTSPEISPIFGQALAIQVAQIFELSSPDIIEVGAGSGRLAADLLLKLENLGCLPESYKILDLSGELRQRQEAALRQYCPHLLPLVSWLNTLPENFNGLVFGNEVIDAIPTHLVSWNGCQKSLFIAERGVAEQEGRFIWQDRPATGKLLQKAQILAEDYFLSDYLSEINLIAADWISAWGSIVKEGVMLLIDYGFPQREYYHPQRYTGTLMCHYRHHAHSDPFFLPGLQDITSHVDFTSIAEAGHEAGFNILGYTTQGAFLQNCGIAKLLEQALGSDRVIYLKQAQAVYKLISPTDMGELFKVIALGKNIHQELLGFSQGDRSLTL